MSSQYDIDHELPSLWQSVVFSGKTRLLQWRRWLLELGASLPVHHRKDSLTDTPVVSEIRAPLWTHISAAEFPLTAGKVQNLRTSALALNGLEIPAGQVFSFWAQLGRTKKSAGYVAGRELREGCLIPSTGGGLCQLSGLLYGAALDAGFEIVERHAHSRKMPGSLADSGRDATVFWNYVDLRFRAPFDWRLEVEMAPTDLMVRIRSAAGKVEGTEPYAVPLLDQGIPDRATPSGDCLTCQQTACFRHPRAVAAFGSSQGHTAFMLDACWPEFDSWCSTHARSGDCYSLPLDGRSWKKPNYSWTVPDGVRVHYETLHTLLRSWRQRSLPAQGASRQAALLVADEALAKSYAARLHPECRHLIVSQNLLPFLWRAGVLGGRTFDVLLHRWPMELLAAQLDDAARVHPASPTLADFRPQAGLVRAEKEALAAASLVITPHRALAAQFGSRALLLDWQMPEHAPRSGEMRPPAQPRFFFPASALARKGVYELASALRGLDASLDVLGSATEGGNIDPLYGLNWRQATLADMPSATAVVLPAWIEHQPRLALRALAMGIPVIATAGCGLPDHPLLHRLGKPDAIALGEVLTSFLPAAPASSSNLRVSALQL